MRARISSASFASLATANLTALFNCDSWYLVCHSAFLSFNSSSSFCNSLSSFTESCNLAICSSRLVISAFNSSISAFLSFNRERGTIPDFDSSIASITFCLSISPSLNCPNNAYKSIFNYSFYVFNVLRHERFV